MPLEVSSLFVSSGSNELKDMAKIAAIIFSFTYLTRWLSYTTQSLFQAIEKALPAIIVISLGFSLIFPLA